MISAVIVAAGSSSRMGFDKLFVELAGKPVIAHTLLNFQNCPDITEIIIVTQKNKISKFEDLKEQFHLSKISKIVEGGQQRQDSVYQGILATNANCLSVAIHDGARPLATPSLISKTLAAARQTGASVAAAKVVDTIKQTGEDSATIVKTIDREKLWTVHTPQVFRKELILKGYEEIFRRQLSVTDDTAALELIGHPVQLVDTGRANIKITTPEDLAIAEILLGKNKSDLVGE